MATLNELTYNIKNIAYGGSTNTEQTVSNNQIKFWIHYYRAQILGEMLAAGQGLPYDCYQGIAINQNMDLEYAGEAWETYVNGQTTNNAQIIPFSARTAVEAGISKFDLAITNEHNFHGLDLMFSHDFEDPGDYGIIRLAIPDLITINEGIKHIFLTEADNIETRKGAINVLLATGDEVLNSEYNRFTKNNPIASVSRYSTGQLVLAIKKVKSNIYGTNGYATVEMVEDEVVTSVIPKSYFITISGVLKDPTKNGNWNDDMEYPLPQELISDLNRRILSAELQMSLAAPSDKITDNADTTKFVQQKASPQVRKQ